MGGRNLMANRLLGRAAHRLPIDRDELAASGHAGLGSGAEWQHTLDEEAAVVLLVKHQADGPLEFVETVVAGQRACGRRCRRAHGGSIAARR